MSRLVEWSIASVPAAAMLIYKLLPLFHLSAHLVGAPHPH